MTIDSHIFVCEWKRDFCHNSKTEMLFRSTQNLFTLDKSVEKRKL